MAYIFDIAYSVETSNYHTAWFHFAVRDRVRQANKGNSDNMVMWRFMIYSAAAALFDDWMTAFAADTSNPSGRARVIRTKPANFVDGCYDKSTPPVFVADPLPFTTKPVSNRLVQAGCQPGAGRDVGLIRTVAEESDLRRHEVVGAVRLDVAPDAHC